jgi:hypothetical protein
LDRLPYAEGASFDPNKVCLPNTRTALLDNLWSWINSIDVKKTAEIFLLTSVAGAGKTAIAHTITERCNSEKIHSSCFFFDQEVSGRNDPKLLFSTTARDLADQNDDFAQQVAHALDKRKSLVDASSSLHFAELILGPSRHLPVDRPVVIVIDALDEGYDLAVLKIFRDEVPKLPGTFRILITSRMIRELGFHLLKKSHVRPWSIDIEEPTNMQDTTLYASHRPQEVAELGYLADGWPGSVLLNDFILKAGGLFIWISAVSEYLRGSTNPDAKLKLLLSKQGPLKLIPEKKMDHMYSSILLDCDWEDEDFVKGYNLLMDAIMAAKTPLSTSVLQSLHRHDNLAPVRNYLDPFASLLTSLEHDNTPVKILHLSLKEFLTIRAQSPESPTSQNLFLSEKEHSQRLGLLCLKVMNEDLEKCKPATGYLENAFDLDSVPNIGENIVSEQLLYACNFWIDHVVEIELPEAGVVDELRKFLSDCLVSWVEISASKGQFHNLSDVREWLAVSI